MKIYVTYKFLTKEDRDAFYKAIKENHIQELSLSDEGCLKYSYTPKDDTVLFFKGRMGISRLTVKTFNSASYGLVEGIKEPISVSNNSASWHCLFRN